MHTDPPQEETPTGENGVAHASAPRKPAAAPDPLARKRHPEFLAYMITGESEKAAQCFPDLNAVPYHYKHVLADVYIDLGTTRYKNAMQAPRATALPLLEDACAQYVTAIALEPKAPGAYYYWGVALDTMAQQCKGVESQRLREAACEKYAAAIAIKPDMHEALSTWGIALSKLARQGEASAAQRLFGAACEKFAAAIAIKPDKHSTLDHWGNVLIELACFQEGAQRRDTLLAARERCMQAESLKPGAAAYNLACIAALLGEPDAAKPWLATAQAHGRLPDRAHLEADTDLDALRGAPWFQALLASLPAAP